MDAVDHYAALHGGFRWQVPAQFNIAEVCCRRWAARSLALGVGRGSETARTSYRRPPISQRKAYGCPDSMAASRARASALRTSLAELVSWFCWSDRRIDGHTDAGGSAAYDDHVPGSGMRFHALLHFGAIHGA